MVVCNYSALTPTTVYLQWRYMEYILWWYVITSLSHLRKRRYSGNLEYILWRCSNFFAIALTMEWTWSTYYGGIETSQLSHIRHGGDQNTAEIQSQLGSFFSFGLKIKSMGEKEVSTIFLSNLKISSRSVTQKWRKPQN